MPSSRSVSAHQPSTHGAPAPRSSAALFTVVHKFETAKGLIDKGPTLVDNPVKLAQFLEAGRFVTQLRPGATGE
jgi:hypothetical protein